MALAPINPTQLTPPRVALIDERSGAISREWYRFFLSLLTATETNQQEVGTAPDANALMATYDSMLASLAQDTQTNTSDLAASLQQQINDVFNATAVAPPAQGGTVTSVDASGGSTGLLFTGGPITTSGTLTLSGTLNVANGGTGQTSYTNGQLLIGNTTGNTLTKTTLTAGTAINISNGAGSITVTNTAPDQIVSLTGAGTTVVSGTYPSFTITSNDAFVGTVTSVSGTGTVNGITLTGTVTSSGSLTLGGTLSNVSLATQVTGTLPVGNGGTGVTTSTGSGNNVLSTQPSFGSTIGVGGASASASGAGISFPASQSASTDPNTLDDYEEGSCTITIQDSASNSATMGGGNVFRYVKVGAFVQVSGTLNWTSIASLSAGSRIQFHGLPFVVNNVGSYRAPAIIGSSASGSFNITRAEIAAGADNGNTFIFGTKVSGNNVDGNMVPADLGSSGTVYGFQINYTTTF